MKKFTSDEAKKTIDAVLRNPNKQSMPCFFYFVAPMMIKRLLKRYQTKQRKKKS